MYRSDEITDPKHHELRSNLDEAIKALLQYEENMEAPKQAEKPHEVEMVVRALVGAEVLTKGDQVSILMFTSTGDMATWNAAGISAMLSSYVTTIGWEKEDE